MKNKTTNLIFLPLIMNFALMQKANISELSPINSQPSVLIKNADYVGIIRGIPDENWRNNFYKRFTEHGTEFHAIYRHYAQSVLTLWGKDPGKTITFVTDAVYGEDVDARNNATLMIQPKLYLVYLYLPNENGVVKGNVDLCELKLENKDQFFLGKYMDGVNLVELPEGEYAIEGSTPNERWVSILTQAYEKSGLYYSIRSGAYFHYIAKGVSHFIPQEGGQQFYDFYVQKIEPRLLKKAGDDLVQRSYVLSDSATIGIIGRVEDYRAVIQQIDETWPNPDDEDIPLNVILPKRADGPGEDYDYIDSLLNARVASIRYKALMTYQHTGEMRKNPKKFVKMLDDPSKKVRGLTIHLMQSIQDPSAPKPKFSGLHKVSNEQEIIQYWKDKYSG